MLEDTAIHTLRDTHQAIQNRPFTGAGSGTATAVAGTRCWGGQSRSRNATLPANLALLRNVLPHVMAPELEHQSLPQLRERLPPIPLTASNSSPVHELKTKDPGF